VPEAGPENGSGVETRVPISTSQALMTFAGRAGRLGGHRGDQPPPADRGKAGTSKQGDRGEAAHEVTGK